MNQITEDILMHYGTKYYSGRYPYGSGENPFQHDGNFYSRVKDLRKAGMSEVEIAKSFGLTTTQYRAQVALAKAEKRSIDAAKAMSLSEKGLTPTEIGKIMGIGESSVRSLLDQQRAERMNAVKNATDIIRKNVDEKGMIDVGVGVEQELGISKEKMRQALAALEVEGYYTFKGRVPQATNPGKYTTMTVICPPGTEYTIDPDTGDRKSSAIYDLDNIHTIENYISNDNGKTFHDTFRYPESLDSKRLAINYAEDGGLEKDGLIEIRRGCEDLSLGDSRYSQVRILVDGTHYLKGMATYSDDLPDGVDVRFNTNKSKDTPALGKKGNTVLKNIEKDSTNPFGSAIRKDGQSYYDDPNGKYADPNTGQKQSMSLINKTREEGDWNTWSKKLPAQFLSKQKPELIRKQLELSAADKKQEYDEISKLTNPTVKKQLLESFARDCDSTSVHLDAAALPRQKYQVILPVESLKDNEVYAPNYKSGETVALVRFPHGGTFEIPVLKVNNNNEEAKKRLGTDPTSQDAIGVNKHTANRLSGADFDGDTVLVIPCNSSKTSVKVTSTSELKGLKDFDPTLEYGGKEEGTYKHIKKGAVQSEMGKISNLITDMTLKGATEDELSRAVKHSMVIIDADKHDLDYKLSEQQNGIDALKRKYQSHKDDEGYGGASTLLSRAKSQTQVEKRQGSPKINEDGTLSYKTATDLTYETAKIDKKSSTPNATIHLNKKGTVYAQPDGSNEWLKVTSKTTDSSGKPLYSENSRVSVSTVTNTRHQKSTQMAETNDARTLISEYNAPAERLYADYANALKTLANDARKQSQSTSEIKYSASAKAAYEDEVKSLDTKLSAALKNAPKERQAQRVSRSRVNALKEDNPAMTKEEETKIGQTALIEARDAVGAKRTTIDITDKEWEAIQAGAISSTKLKQILNHTDTAKVRELAMPKQSKSNKLSNSQVNLILSYANSGFTIEEIADALGLSTSTIWNVINKN